MQVLPGKTAGLPEDDRLLVFAINTHHPFASISPYVFALRFDTNGDDQIDAFLVGVDLGRATTGESDGQYAALLIGPDFSVLDVITAVASPNGSTALLAAPASSLGLTGSGNSAFSYGIHAYSDFDPDLMDPVAGMATFDPFRPAVSQGDQGDQVMLRPSQTTLLRQVEAKNVPPNQVQLGWMLVTTDDAGGAAQADLVSLGK